jgi:hypothetical protein
MVFVMEIHCESCEVGTEYLNIIYINVMLQRFIHSTEAWIFMLYTQNP